MLALVPPLPGAARSQGLALRRWSPAGMLVASWCTLMGRWRSRPTTCCAPLRRSWGRAPTGPCTRPPPRARSATGFCSVARGAAAGLHGHERVFQRGREFVPDRFAVCSDDDERRRMLEHVVWSNGPETGVAAEGNKQCPGKDAVVAVGWLMVVELLPHATARRRRGSLPWTVQASTTGARRSSTSPHLRLT